MSVLEFAVAITFMLNGRSQTVDAPPEMPLLWALRDVVGLTGTKYGCGMALCGACTVHIDGQPTRSCVTPIEALGNRAVTTIEGVAQGAVGRVAAAVQAAWIARDVAQCGYCQSGQVMAATALLAANPRPSDTDIDQAMSGNICRCGTYPRIRAAVHDAAKSLSA